MYLGNPSVYVIYLNATIINPQQNSIQECSSFRIFTIEMHLGARELFLSLCDVRRNQSKCVLLLFFDFSNIDYTSKRREQHFFFSSCNGCRALNRLQQCWYTITITTMSVSIWVGKITLKQFHKATEWFNKNEWKKEHREIWFHFVCSCVESVLAHFVVCWKSGSWCNVQCGSS